MIDSAAFLHTHGRGTGVAAILSLAVLAGGCASSDSQSTASSGSTNGTAAADDSDVISLSDARTTEEINAALDARNVIGPTAARALGYRVSWNVTGGTTVGVAKQTAVQGDSIFTVDAGNNLTRVLRDTGVKAWSWPVGGSADRVLGILRSRRGDTDIVMALTEGDLHVFDVTNGVQIDRQRLNQRVAATAPALYGDMIVYGSLNGQIVWHHYNLNSFVKGSTLLGAISAAPVMRGNVLVAVTERGEVGALHAGGRGLVWRRTTRDPIVANAAISQYAVYVAGRDQFIRCYDAQTGEEIWKALHSEPFDQPPVVLGDNVYVQSDDLGLCCYEAFPFQDLDGNLLWNNDDAPGTVIGRHRGNLITWDERSRVITLVTERGGEFVESINLPNARTILVDGFDSGDIYGIGDGGQITRLVPRR